MCKSTEIQGEWHGIRDGCVTHRQPKSNREVFWSSTKKYLQQSIIIASQEWAVFFSFFYDLNASAKNQSQSDGTVERSILIALIVNNMFRDVSHWRWCLRGEKKSSVWELVCQNEPLSSRPPLPVIFPQTGREAELLGHSNEHARKWASAQSWHRLWFLHTLKEAKIYISEILISPQISSGMVTAPRSTSNSTRFHFTGKGFCTTEPEHFLISKHVFAFQ